MMRRVGAALTLLGTVSLGVGAMAGAAGASGTVVTPGFHPSGTNTFGAQSPNTEACNGVIYTPGSDPATKRITSGDFTPGSVVGFEVFDTAHKNGGANTYVLHDCVVAYPAATFTAADFQDAPNMGEPAQGSEGKFKGPNKVVIDHALLTQIPDNTKPVTYTWTVPTWIPPLTWICNFVKDTGNNHDGGNKIGNGDGGNGNRKAAACGQVPAPPTTSSTSSSSTSSTSSSSTSTAPTTVAPTTVAPTTVAPTTVAPTTVAPTTAAPTTAAPTTAAPTTAPPTTAGSQVQASQGTTTVPPTTKPPGKPTPTTLPTQVLPLTATRTLPFTGSDTRPLVLAAGVLLLLGGMLLLGTDRQRD